jgi:putative ATP-binding cassette transporter
VLARLNALAEASDAAQGAGGVAIVEDETRFACEELTVLAPHDTRPLVRALSVDVAPGSRWLVTGPDNLVTDALLLAIAGLWPHGSGRVVHPGPAELFLFPERPYLPPSTLREMLVRDPDQRTTADDRIWDALHRAGADAAARRVGGLDTQNDWNGVLSLDEQRLVGVAHLLLTAPRFAVLADLAASLGTERAADVLATLRERGTGYVVLGDAAALGDEQFDGVIEIATDGSWTRQPGR